MADDDNVRLLVSLEAKLNAFEKAFNKASGVADTGFKRVEKRCKEAGERMSASMGEAVEGINRSLELVGLGLGLREIEEMIDSYNTLKTRVDLASGSVEKGAEVMEALGTAAKSARVSQDALADSYLKNHAYLTSLNYSTQEQIDYQQSLATALKLSGASADQAAGVTDLLSKAIDNGGIKGKQLSTVMLEGGRAAEAMADYLHVPVSQLALLSEQGKITSNVIVDALIASASKLNAELAKKPWGMGEVVVQLKEALQDYIGKAAEASGFNDDLGKSAKFVLDNFNQLADGAAAAAAVILSRYVPALAKIAVTTLTNPWLALAAGAAAAAYEIENYNGKIKLADGSLVNLKDVAGAAWDEIKAGGEIAAENIQAAYVEAVQFITKALSGVGISMSDLEQFTINIAQGIVSSFVFVYDETIAVFRGLPPAIAEIFVDAFNGVISIVEGAIQKIVDAANYVISLANMAGDKVGAHIPTFDKIDLGRVQNDYAGAGKKLGQALADGLEDAAKPRVRNALNSLSNAAHDALDDFNKKAEARAKARQQAEAEQKSKSESSSTSTNDATGPHLQAPNVQWNQDIQKFQQNISLMQAETAARKVATGTVEEQDAAVEAFKQEQQLLNQAVAAGVPVNDELVSKIQTLGDAYRQASLAAKEQAKSIQEMRQAASQFEGAEKSAFTGFFDDMAQGKSASEALRNSLANLGKKLMDIGLNQIANKMFDGTGSFLAQPGSGSVGSANIAAGVVNVGGTATSLGAPTLTPLAGGTTGSTLPSPSNPLGGLGALFGLGAPAALAKSPVTTGSIPAPALAKSFAAPVVGSAGSAPGASALSLASGLVGKNEIANRGEIDSFLKKGGVDIDAAQTAWCAGFVNSSLKQVGIKGTGNQTASSFLDFGQKVKPQDVLPGDIGIIDRGVKPGQPGDHVGFLTGQSRIGANGQQQLQMLSGNSADKVRYTYENADRLQIRRATQDINGNPLNQQPAQIAQPQQLALQQQTDAEKALEQQTLQANTALKTMPPSLQGVQVGSQGLDGSLASMTSTLAQGQPAASSFSSSIQSVLASLTAKPGVGGGLGSIFGFAEGGPIKGPGSSKSDSIPAMLSDGEFVVNADAAKKHGPLLSMLNAGKVPHFAAGGPVAFGFNNSPSNVTNITVHAPGAQRGVGDEIKAAVGKALDARQKPVDTFRRTDMQKLSELHLRGARAGQRNG